MKSLCSLAVLTILIAGCSNAPGVPTQNAVIVSLPTPVVVDKIHRTMSIAPALEIRNLSGDTLGIVHVGGFLNNVIFEYELVDPSGMKIPAIRTDSTLSTLSVGRIGVSLLKPGESMKWTPPDLPTYTITKKGKYRLIVHAQVSAPAPIYLGGMSDTDRQQITADVHRFDSDPLSFTVD